MERAVSFLGLASLLVCLSASSAITAEKVRVASSGFTPLHSIIWAAHHQNIFRKYGLETEYLALNSATLGVQTLLANEIQFLFLTGALAVTQTVRAVTLQS